MVLWHQGMNSLMECPSFLPLSLPVQREDERRGTEIKATNTHQVLTMRHYNKYINYLVYSPKCFEMITVILLLQKRKSRSYMAIRIK